MSGFHKVDLNPNSPTNFTRSETICLVDGDFPYIIFEDASGKKYALHLGQSLPVSGSNVRLFNPFDRPGQGIIARNMPIRLEGVRNPFDELRPQTGHVEYHMSISQGLGDGSLKIGAGILSEKSRIYFEADFADGTKVETFTDATLDFLDAKPAGFMENAEAMALHTSGDAHSTIRNINGEYSATDVPTWIANAGYTGTISTIAKGVLSWKGIIEPGTAIFLYMSSDKEWKVNARILDMGRFYADEASE